MALRKLTLEYTAGNSPRKRGRTIVRDILMIGGGIAIAVVSFLADFFIQMVLGLGYIDGGANRPVEAGDEVMSHMANALPVIGCLAGVILIVYCAYLGTRDKMELKADR